MFNLEGHHFPYFKAIYCHFMANFGPKLPYLAISGSSCLKWVEHWLNTVEHCISHPGGSVGTFFPPEKWPSGAPEGPENAQFGPKIAIFGHKWFQVQPVFNKAILGVGFSIGKTHKDIYCVPFYFWSGLYGHF